MVTCVPLENHADRNTRQSMENFGFPAGTDKVDEPTIKNNNSCFKDLNITMNETVNGEMKEVVIPTRDCCSGYTGTECDILSDPFISTDPCNNKTCPNDPQAQCAVINQCGSQVSIFLNNLGQIVDCGNVVDADNTMETSSGGSSDEPADTSISTISCQGFCDHDPCKDLTCPMYEGRAFCFQSGCDCQPLWILDTGVQVNCTSGMEVNPLIAARARRQALYPTISLSSCS